MQQIIAVRFWARILELECPKNNVEVGCTCHHINEQISGDHS